MEVMQGFPPKEGARATLANWRTSPWCHWAFHHVREIVPTARIGHDPGSVWTLPRRSVDFDISGIVAAQDTWDNDALVILHRGAIVHEDYRRGMRAEDTHIIFSISKSLLGLVAGALQVRGLLDVDAPVTAYLPELARTAYAGATIRQALDMQVGVQFNEDYLATDGPIVEYRRAANWNPLPTGEHAMDLRSFQGLLTAAEGPHGQRFHYVSPVTDMLGWAFERAAGRRFADLVSDCLQRPMGAEADGDLTVDRIGGARAAGGICLTARDLARVGQLMLQDGAREGVQVLPRSWVDDIWSGGDRAAWDAGDFAMDFPGAAVSYRSKWYVHHGAEPMLQCRGIHGQYLFVDRARDLVVAWLSSHGQPSEAGRTEAVLSAVLSLRGTLSG